MRTPAVAARAGSATGRRASSSRARPRPAAAAHSASSRGSGASAASAARTAPRRLAGGSRSPRRQGAGRLDREERVALGGAHDAGHVVGAERRDAPREPGDGGRGERLEGERADEDPAGAERLLERVDLRARRQRAAGEEDEHGQPARAPSGVGEQLERRRVGEVDVLERERERPVPRGPLEQLDRRLVQAHALEVGRRGEALDGLAAEPEREVGNERREVRRPCGGGGRRGELAAEVGEELGPRRERRAAAGVGRAAEVDRGAGGGQRPVAAGTVEQLEDEARLAHARLGDDRDHRAPARAGGVPRGGELRELAVAPDERQPRRSVGPRGPGRRGRGERRAGRGRAEVVGRAPRLGRGCDPQLAAQALAQPVVHADRRGALAGGREAAHQPAVGRFVEAVERRLPARPREGCGRVARVLGGAREPLEDADQGLAVRGARLDRPVVVELGQELPAAHRDGLLEPPRRRQVGEGAGVDPDRVRTGEADLSAVRHQRVGGGAERSAHRPHRGAQAPACARVEHVGPEPRREVRPRMRPGMQREPRQERPRPAPGGRLDRGAVGLDAQRPEHVDPEHGPTLALPGRRVKAAAPGPGGVDGRLTVA